MTLKDLDIIEERKEFLKMVCLSINPRSVTISDGNWESICREITEINQRNINKVFDK